MSIHDILSAVPCAEPTTAEVDAAIDFTLGAWEVDDALRDLWCEANEGLWYSPDDDAQFWAWHTLHMDRLS